MFVLGYGLTVKGKPLKDQIDVQNHANAVDAVMNLVARGCLFEEVCLRASPHRHSGRIASAMPLAKGGTRS